MLIAMWTSEIDHDLVTPIKKYTRIRIAGVGESRVFHDGRRIDQLFRSTPRSLPVTQYSQGDDAEGRDLVAADRTEDVGRGAQEFVAKSKQAVGNEENME